MIFATCFCSAFFVTADRSGLPFRHQFGIFPVMTRAAAAHDPTIARTIRFPLPHCVTDWPQTLTDAGGASRDKLSRCCVGITAGTLT